MILLFLSYHNIKIQCSFFDHMSENLYDPPFCTAYFFMTIPFQGLKKLWPSPIFTPFPPPFPPGNFWQVPDLENKGNQ